MSSSLETTMNTPILTIALRLIQDSLPALLHYYISHDPKEYIWCHHAGSDLFTLWSSYAVKTEVGIAHLIIPRVPLSECDSGDKFGGPYPLPFLQCIYSLAFH